MGQRMRTQSPHLFSVRLIILMSAHLTAISGLPLSQIIDQSLQRLRSQRNPVTSGAGVQVKSAASAPAQIFEPSPAGLGSAPDLSLPVQKAGPHARSTSPSVSSTGLRPASLHPFLNFKRDRRHAACEHPSRLPERVLELNSYLSHSLLVGLDKEEEKPELPADQPGSDVCSSAYDPLLATAKEPNLRTTCPWVWENKDLGEDIYPRYVRTAHCLCDDCLGSTSLSCQSIDRNITVLKRDGCNNGLAVFEEVTRTVSVACGCAIPRMQL